MRVDSSFISKKSFFNDKSEWIRRQIISFEVANSFFFSWDYSPGGAKCEARWVLLAAKISATATDTSKKCFFVKQPYDFGSFFLFGVWLLIAAGNIELCRINAQRLFYALEREIGEGGTTKKSHYRVRERVSRPARADSVRSGTKQVNGHFCNYTAVKLRSTGWRYYCMKNLIFHLLRLIFRQFKRSDKTNKPKFNVELMVT